MNSTCYICDRVPFGEIQCLGEEKWRHAACAPGSADWGDYYRRLAPAQRTSAGDLLLAHLTRHEKPVAKTVAVEPYEDLL